MGAPYFHSIPSHSDTDQAPEVDAAAVLLLDAGEGSDIKTDLSLCSAEHV